MDNWKCTLIDMKTFELVETKIINVKDLFDQTEILIKNDIINVRQFYYEIITKLFFPNHILQKPQTQGLNGIPDFLLIDYENFKEKKWIEFKSPNDNLRRDQIKWFLENKDKNIYLLLTEEIDNIENFAKKNNQV